MQDPLVTTMFELPTVVPYFDLSLQHASAGLLRRMKRWGSGERFLTAIERIRAQEPDAVFRSSFIVGFPGETEADHDELLAFLARRASTGPASSRSPKRHGTAASTLDGEVDEALMHERLRECTEVQDPITAASRERWSAPQVEVLVDGDDDDGLVGRTYREAPEIDGVVRLMGAMRQPGRDGARRAVTGAVGPDLEASA